MKQFKVYGEERSATTYLEKLIALNSDLELLNNKVKPLSKWKHGFPHYWGDQVLHVFLMRDLFQWIRSVITHDGGRFNGLQSEFGNVQGQRQHDHWQAWDNLLQCRTAKYRSYLEFKSEYPCVLLKTEYLQSHPDVICDFISVSDFKDIRKHLRLGIDQRNDPDRRALTQSEKEWVFENHDPEIENFVDNLTYINAL